MQKSGSHQHLNKMYVLDNAMQILIKSWFGYVTIWINGSGQEIVDVFATEQCQMIRRFLYWDVLVIIVFIILYYVKLKTAWGISNEGQF